MNLQCIKINDMTQLDWYIPFEVICRKVPVDKKNTRVIIRIVLKLMKKY